MRLTKLLTPLALTALAALSGCAHGDITGVRTAGPDSAELILDVVANELYDFQQPNSVVVTWAGYQARVPVPVKGGLQPEVFTLTVSDWAYMPNAARLPITVMECEYLLGERRIRRRRFPTPFSSPKVIAEHIKRQREAPAPRPEERPRERDQQPRERDQRSTDDQPQEISRNMDSPTVHPYPRELVCRLDAGSGSRYLRLDRTPRALVRLIIDVRSHGDPRSTSEVTWWEIELLDEVFRPLPFHERELVDLGREMRHVVDWRLDGSPVIFKLTSGSDAGDTVRIRFEELE